MNPSELASTSNSEVTKVGAGELQGPVGKRQHTGPGRGTVAIVSSSLSASGMHLTNPRATVK